MQPNLVNLEESFAPGKSLLHRLDPRIKLLVAVAFSFVVVFLRDPFVLLLALAFSISIVFLGRPRLRVLGKRLAVINIFVSVLWLFLPWSTPGEEIAHLGPLILTREGVFKVLVITIRCNAALLALIGFLGTSGIVHLAYAMERLHIPEKLVVIFFFCIRYVNVIYGEYRRLSDAVAIRGFTPGTTFHTYRTYGNLISVLLLRSNDRSERVYEAMICRGFSGSFPVVSRLRLTGEDFLAAILLISFVVLLGVIEWRMTTF